MDAHNALLLSEGHQLGIISYHPYAQPSPRETSPVVKVLTVQVRLVKSVHLLPLQSTIAIVKVKESG